MSLDFSTAEGNIIPVVIQDSVTNKVLTVGYFDQTSYERTVETETIHLYNRKESRLLTEEEVQELGVTFDEIIIDNERNLALLKVKSTIQQTSFGESNAGKGAFLNYLQAVINERKNNPSDESYTASLFARGINKIAQKVGEEAVEIVIEAKDDNKELFLGEAADLLFHLTVLFEAKNYRLDEAIDVLLERHK